MRRAIELAAQATGKTSPNPCVGCVIVINGTVVGEGWHKRAGSAHAEVNALLMAGGKAAGTFFFFRFYTKKKFTQ
jgi:diaminohydroxyphosphoribosylaminopyrimidine deaminase/5-amino-6-(5-phosphoribosylamino)uracil reductase